MEVRSMESAEYDNFSADFNSSSLTCVAIVYNIENIQLAMDLSIENSPLLLFAITCPLLTHFFIYILSLGHPDQLHFRCTLETSVEFLQFRNQHRLKHVFCLHHQTSTSEVLYGSDKHFCGA